MSLKLYYDFMSQPSRALYILLKTAKCEFTPRPVALRKDEHYQKEFTAINRFQRVPVIDHNGFILTESVAIMKYLSRENLIPETLYPKEKKLQARVEEYLEWQHIGLRLHCTTYFTVKWLEPILLGKSPDPTTIEKYEQLMKSALDAFNSLWLGQGNQFISGNTVTVADLLAACELEQPRVAGFDPSEKYTNISEWLKKVRSHFSPHYEEAHVYLHKSVQNQKKMATNL